MIEWYWALLIAVSFTAWTLLCILIGAGIVTNNAKGAQAQAKSAKDELAELKARQSRQRSELWPERENR